MDEMMEALEAENIRLREQLFLAKSSIPEEYGEDLAILARAHMSEEKSFEEAAEEVARKYAHILGPPAKGIGMRPAADDDRDIRRAMGLI